MNGDRIFYVYEHWRPDTGACFYVGKGSAARAYKMGRGAGRNAFHVAIVNKLKRLGMCVEISLISDCLTESEALSAEIERIAYWRDLGVELTNATDGGERNVINGVAINAKAVTCLSDGMTFDSMTHAAKYYGVSSSDISEACRFKTGRVCVGGRYFVCGRYDLPEKERIQRIDRIVMARAVMRKRKNKIKTSDNPIVDGLDKLGRRANGPMKNRVPVICLSDGLRFSSCRDASRYYGIDNGALSKALRGVGGRKTLGGRKFIREDS